MCGFEVKRRAQCGAKHSAAWCGREGEEGERMGGGGKGKYSVRGGASCILVWERKKGRKPGTGDRDTGPESMWIGSESSAPNWERSLRLKAQMKEQAEYQELRAGKVEEQRVFEFGIWDGAREA
ncbi:hypothetical protein NMY22_g5570 [Coprinellus aureogranulatus]|nr:hypothetical protein NMY22_g5570 [Coprinellus aureogranulatus]